MKKLIKLQFVSTLKVNFALFGLIWMEPVTVLRIGKEILTFGKKKYIINIESEKRNLLLKLRK